MRRLSRQVRSLESVRSSIRRIPGNRLSGNLPKHRFRHMKIVGKLFHEVDRSVVQHLASNGVKLSSIDPDRYFLVRLGV